MHELNVLEFLDGAHVIERRFALALMYTGLRIPQFRAMNFLSQSGRLTVSELSDKLGVTRASASNLVNELIKAGIATSQENESDKRSFYVSLTDSGKRRLVVARNDISIVQMSISRNFPESTIQQLNEFSELIKHTYS